MSRHSFCRSPFSFFCLFQPVFDLLVYASAIQLVLLKQLYCRAGLAEYIIYANLLHRSRKLLTTL